MTDSFNSFVEVAISKSIERITVSCTFLNQPLEAAKSCGVVYSPSCNNLSSIIPASITVDTSNSVVLKMENRMVNITKLCFEVTASNDTKTVKVIYASGKYDCKMVYKTGSKSWIFCSCHSSQM